MKIAFRKKCHTIYSRIICFLTFGKYSHSELVFSDGKSFSADESDGGTRWKDWQMSDDEWDFIDIPCNKTQEKEIRKFCEGEDGLKYDMIGIGFSFLPIPIGWQSAEKWFCSEICAAALQQIGYLVGYTPSRISPNKLYSLLKNERRFRIKSLPLTLVVLLMALLFNSSAFANGCECLKAKELREQDLRAKLKMASMVSKLMADEIVTTSPKAYYEREKVLEQYRYWADEVEKLFEESIDEASTGCICNDGMF